MTSSDVTVTDTATLIINNTDNLRRTYRIRNGGANPITLGDSTVVFGIGYTLAVGDSLPLRLGLETLSGICAAAMTSIVEILV